MENLHNKILRHGAEGGALLGIVFVALFAAMVASPGVLTSLIAIFLFIAVPFIAGRLLRKSYVASAGTFSFSALWLEGIIMFLGGSLILTVGSYIFFRWISPDFIVNQLNLAAELFSQDPQTAQMADMMHHIIEMHKLPRPIEFSMSLMWTTAFSGSLVSLILAAVAKARPLPPSDARRDFAPGEDENNLTQS